jgi:CDP-glycerol glycerophosphotransferase
MPDAPLISVVVPVYGVREYLPQCLDSLLGPPGGPRLEVPAEMIAVEVIAVDDASPDGSGALLDERARDDDRLTVIHLDRNGGQGNARNIGLAKAAGEYVWFADGDDLLADGALAAVAGRLADCRPDLLVIDYQDLLLDGSTRASTGADLLRAAPAGEFTLADDPQLINLTMTSWSKLFRRDFLLGLNEPFRSGIHEDIPVTAAALFAGRLCALPRVCYTYRRSRQGSAMMSSAGQQAVFDAYHEVLGMLGELAAAGDQVATPAVQRAVFERAIWHYASVLSTTGPGIGPLGRGGLVPRSQRRQFWDRMHADYVRYLPAGYTIPPGPRGAKLRLIARDAYWTYEALEPVNRLRVAIRSALRRI